MQLFKDVIDECSFLDLEFMGNCFTWCKQFKDGHSIWERLDRGMANDSWFQKFPGTIIHHLQSNSSDHYPLLINLSGLDPPPKKEFSCSRRCGYQMNVVLKRLKNFGLPIPWGIVTVIY